MKPSLTENNYEIFIKTKPIQSEQDISMVNLANVYICTMYIDIRFRDNLNNLIWEYTDVCIIENRHKPRPIPHWKLYYCRIMK